MFDEETQSTLDGKDADIILALQEGLEKRARAKQLKDEAAELIKDANDLLMPIMTALDITKAVAPGIGMLLFNPAKKSTGFSKQKAAEYLVGHGVSADTVKDAWIEATTESFKPEVKFNLK